MKRVVILGASGFIGYSVLKQMRQHDVDVIAVVRENCRKKEKLEKFNVKVVECNLEHVELLKELLKNENIDTMYHFAWQGVSGAGLRDENVQIMNVEATLKLIDVCKKLKIGTFIGAGSIHENEAIKEMSENKRVYNYGMVYKAAKIMAHYAAKAKAGAMGINFFWPVITNTYGIGEDSERLINTIIKNFINGKSTDVTKGEQLYNFIYIDDLAKAYYLIGEHGIDGNNYVIASDRTVPLKEYLQELEHICKNYCNRSIGLGYGNKADNAVYLSEKDFDNKTLKRDTGFIPTVTFEHGIIKTINSLQKQSKSRNGGGV